MTTIIADSAMKASLENVKDIAEVRSADGSLIGYFAATAVDQAKRYAAAFAKIDWDEVERRRKANRPGLTTRQVFQHLQSLTDDPAKRAELQKLIDARTEG